MRVRLTIGRYTNIDGTVIFQPLGTVLDVGPDEFAQLVEEGAAVPVIDDVPVEHR